jgi:hypothetical protein
LHYGSSCWSRRWLAALPAAALLAAAAGLSGCSTLASINPFASAASASPPASACPTAAVLRPLSQTAIFRPGAAAQPTTVAFYGILSDVDAKCDRAGGAVRASLDVVIVGERGPAATAAGANSIDLQYFVAVTGPDQTILSKRTLPVHIDIPADARRAGVTDHIEEVIPAATAAGQVNIMLGFQQSPQVVDFYRHFRGR